MPDVDARAADALRVAHLRALSELLKLAPNGPWHDRLARELNALEECNGR